LTIVEERPTGITNQRWKEINGNAI